MDFHPAAWQSHGMRSDEHNERECRELSPIEIVRLLAFELHGLHTREDVTDLQIQDLKALQLRAKAIERKTKRLARAFYLLDNTTARQ